MGFGLSFGAGPLRLYIPIFRKRRKRRKTSRAKTYSGMVTFDDPQLPHLKGKKWKCHHNHKTPQAANECVQKYLRDFYGGKPVAPPK